MCPSAGAFLPPPADVPGGDPLDARDVPKAEGAAVPDDDVARHGHVPAAIGMLVEARSRRVAVELPGVAPDPRRPALGGQQVVDELDALESDAVRRIRLATVETADEAVALPVDPAAAQPLRAGHQGGAERLPRAAPAAGPGR